MSRNNHSFNTKEKHDWRIRNIDFLKKYGRNIWDESKFIGHWIELIGRTGSYSKDLLLQNGASDSQFIGADIDLNTILEHRDNKAAFRTSHNWITSTAREMIRSGLRVSVMNFDGYNSAANEKWWKTEGRIIKAIADEMVYKYGEFGLILNHALRGMKLSKDDAITKHVQMAEDYLEIDKINSVEAYKSEKVNMITIRFMFTENTTITE